MSGDQEESRGQRLYAAADRLGAVAVKMTSQAWIVAIVAVVLGAATWLALFVANTDSTGTRAVGLVLMLFPGAVLAHAAWTIKQARTMSVHIKRSVRDGSLTRLTDEVGDLGDRLDEMSFADVSGRGLIAYWHKTKSFVESAGALKSTVDESRELVHGFGLFMATLANPFYWALVSLSLLAVTVMPFLAVVGIVVFVSG